MDLKKLSSLLVAGSALWIAPVSIGWAQNADDVNPLPEASPLVQEPKTPVEEFDAVLMMLRLGKPELARYYLQQLLDGEPDDATMLQLRDRHDTATFLELIRVPQLEADAKKLADRLQTAIRNHVNDPGYFSQLVKKLSGSSRDRAEAIDEMRYLGPYAVPPLLLELQNPQQTNKGDLVYALTRLGRDANDPLIGALDTTDSELKATLISILSTIGGEDDAIWLLKPAFAEGEDPAVRLAAREALARIRYDSPARTDRLSGSGAADRLLRESITHLTKQYQWPENDRPDGNRVLWSWDPAQRTVSEHVTTPNHASLHYAERLARDAAALAPQRTEPADVLLATLMVRDMDANGWDQPVLRGPGSAHDLAVVCGPETCLDVLRFAQEQKLPGAQLIALQALGLNGSVKMLAEQAGKPSPVVQALDAPDERVQFAAATTILQWAPEQPFRGNRRIVEILARALNGGSQPQSVVIDPNSKRGSETVGLFKDVGYNGIRAKTGMEGFEAAVSHGGVGLAVLHPNTIRWELTETVANLRRDSRTAHLPIVIYGPAHLRDQYGSVFAQFEQVAFVDEANNSLELKRQLVPFLAQISPPPLTQEQRGAQIAEALYWLRRIALDANHVFDLAPAEGALIAASNNPELAGDALVALGAIPKASAQKQLFLVAVGPAVDAAIRQRAALQLGYHIQRFGALLSNTELGQLQAAVAAAKDPRVQTALASVIGSLKPTPEAARKQILSRPISPAPIEVAPAKGS